MGAKQRRIACHWQPLPTNSYSRVKNRVFGSSTVYSSSRGRPHVAPNIAEDDDGRELIALYVGDFDPSGMFMSEEDLPKHLAEYGGSHITVQRIALLRPQLRGLPSSRSPTR